MKSKNSIEFNGTQYDAITGAKLGTTKSVQPTSPAHTSRSVDGVFASSSSRPHVVGAAARPQVTKRAVSRPQPQHVAHHRPQSAATLMRTSVKKPATSFKKQVTVQTGLQRTSPSLLTVKPSVHSVVPERAVRAQSVGRSPHISRYGDKSAHVAVSFASVPVVEPPVNPSQQPSAAPAPSPTNKPVDIFEHAIRNATNFRELPNHAHFKRRKRQHVAIMSAGTLSLLVLGAFIAYQNVMPVRYRVASARAGLGTHLPDVASVGFTINNVSTLQNGRLLTYLVDTHTGAHYRLTSQATNYDSDDMAANIVSTDASGNPQYTTFEASGVKVYRFSNNSATWVQDGVWYQLSGTGGLSTGQISTLIAKL